MDTTKTCPKCGSPDYLFRSRRKLAGENGQGEQTETKYHCKACEHQWKVRVTKGGRSCSHSAPVPM